MDSNGSSLSNFRSTSSSISASDWEDNMDVGNRNNGLRNAKVGIQEEGVAINPCVIGTKVGIVIATISKLIFILKAVDVCFYKHIIRSNALQ
mmetsp:Transcript_17358/g.32905  ORF Transcript_17358/g.32905 Transcript_17358/m.32905 type:complete len:92 (+) Transcript_17358:3114-3389(+)